MPTKLQLLRELKYFRSEVIYLDKLVGMIAENHCQSHISGGQGYLRLVNRSNGFIAGYHEIKSQYETSVDISEADIDLLYNKLIDSRSKFYKLHQEFVTAIDVVALKHLKNHEEKIAAVVRKGSAYERRMESGSGQGGVKNTYPHLHENFIKYQELRGTLNSIRNMKELVGVLPALRSQYSLDKVDDSELNPERIITEADKYTTALMDLSDQYMAKIKLLYAVDLNRLLRDIHAVINDATKSNMTFFTASCINPSSNKANPIFSGSQSLRF